MNEVPDFLIGDVEESVRETVIEIHDQRQMIDGVLVSSVVEITGNTLTVRPA